MKKILNIGESPVQCYPNYGGVFSIIDAETKDYLPWVYNYFLQISVPKHHELGMRLDFTPPDVIASLPWLEVGKLDRDMIHKKWDKISSFVEDAINLGQYVFGLFDVSKISSYREEKPYQHESFIYGYDDELKEFYFSDNNDQGKYMHGKMTYAELIDAERGMEENKLIDWLSGIYLFRYKKLYDFGMCRFSEQYYYKFDTERYKEQIQDFLNSQNTYERWTNPPALINYEQNMDDNVWGIEVYEYIIEHLDLVFEEKEKNDWRAFYVLYEQKVILSKTIEYLKEQSILTDTSELEQLVADSISRSLLSLRLIMKSDMSGDRSILQDVKENLLKLEAGDRKIFGLLLERL